MKKIILLLFFCSIGFAQQPSKIYQRAKVSLNSSHTLIELGKLGIPVDHGIQKINTFIICEFSVSEIQKARNAGFDVEILIDDVKADFLRKNANPPAADRNVVCGNGIIDYTIPANFTLGSMGGYLTYQELLDQLDLMKSLYPNLITTKQNISNFLTEGTPDNSVTPAIGGNGIKWVKISDNPDSSSEGEPPILYTALHHAREPISLSQMVFYMWYLLENYDTNPEIQAIVNNTELYFVPVVNPDGYLYNQKTSPNGGGFWRKNRKDTYGTDLNRNYDYYINGDPNNGTWGGEGASNNVNDETYHGPAPFSEVETQAIKYFVENHNFVMAFNNHTYSNLLLYPYGFTNNNPTPENDLFQGLSQELVSQNGFDNILSSELYPASGDSDDFMYGTVGTHDKIYAFTPEIGNSFWPSSSQIIPLCKEMMYNNITGAHMVNNYAVIKNTSPQYIGSDVNATENFNVRRLGITGTGDFTVSLSPISSNIISAGDPVNINGLQILENQDANISYILESNIQNGDTIAFELTINNGNYDTSIIINKRFGSLSPIFVDSGNSISDNFNNNGWDITTSTFVSPSSSITDSPNGNYQNNENKTITLKNTIELTDAIGANLNFYAKWDLENSYDYVQFEVSTNGGSSWTAQCGKYTNPGSSNGSQPAEEPLYDGSQTDWVLEDIDLTDYLGETILVRFQLRSDSAVTGDGFYFDDLTFNVLNGTLGLSTSEINQFTIFPNPVKDILNIKTSLTDYSFKIYNLQGQLIQASKNNSGSKSIDYSGFATGLYILKFSSAKTSEAFKIVKE